MWKKGLYTHKGKRMGQPQSTSPGTSKLPLMKGLFKKVYFMQLSKTRVGRWHLTCQIRSPPFFVNRVFWEDRHTRGSTNRLWLLSHHHVRLRNYSDTVRPAKLTSALKRSLESRFKTEMFNEIKSDLIHVWEPLCPWIMGIRGHGEVKSLKKEQSLRKFNWIRTFDF